MNDYRITRTTGETAEPITAIDEKDARRIYRETHTAEEAKRAYAIALIRENVPATKAQERDALEKIKAIVATLGPRSYVGTALDGCLEDAEVNIENDFGDSMRARWMEAENRVAQTAREVAAAKEELEEVRKHLQTAEAETADLQAAVRDHKAAKGDLEYYTALAQRIKHARGQ